MRLTRSGSRAILKREEGDQRVRNESDLFYKLRNLLKRAGKDVIKKEMSKDGHMVSDHVYYVRSRKLGRPGAFAIFDDHYAVRDAAEEFNEKGEISLAFVDMSGAEGSAEDPMSPEGWRPDFWHEIEERR